MTIASRTAARELTIEELTARRSKIDHIFSDLMREGVHYGTFRAGRKPSLYKAGAELLATAFGLTPHFEIAQTDLPNGHREYAFTCTMRRGSSKTSHGSGSGLCSTMESAYRWRPAQRVCPQCKAPTIIRGRADYGGGWVCWTKLDGCGMNFPIDDAEITRQKGGREENPDIANTFNTVLKIAKKRSFVDAVLTAVGASDRLTQDLEDMTDEHEWSARDVTSGDVADRVAFDREIGLSEPRVHMDPPQAVSPEYLRERIAQATNIRELNSLMSAVLDSDDDDESAALRADYGMALQRIKQAMRESGANA